MNHILNWEKLAKCSLEHRTPIIRVLKTPEGFTWILTNYRVYLEVQIYRELDRYIMVDIYSDKVDKLWSYITGELKCFSRKPNKD